MRACCICQIDGPTDQILIDGSVFHRRCYDELKDTANSLSRTEVMLLAELQKQPTFAMRIAMLLSESRRLENLNYKQSLTAHVQETRVKVRSIKATLEKIYDVWPGYPPDWEQRRVLIHYRDNSCCAECGVTSMLQLHHRRAIREGGTHRLDNLVFLCGACHSEAHGGRRLEYKGGLHSVDDELPNAIEKKIAIINRALFENKDANFRYRKLDGTVTSRRVTPVELRKLSVSELQSLIGRNARIKKEGRLCLFGYCHLRGAKRTFAIDRIYKITLQ